MRWAWAVLSVSILSLFACVEDRPVEDPLDREAGPDASQADSETLDVRRPDGSPPSDVGSDDLTRLDAIGDSRLGDEAVDEPGPCRRNEEPALVVSVAALGPTARLSSASGTSAGRRSRPCA